MLGHLVGAGVLVFALPYQVFYSVKGSLTHKRVGKVITAILVVQAITGVGSLILQAVRYHVYNTSDDDLPVEHGYALTDDSKFVFLPMFAMGFITPLLNGLGKMVLGLPYKFSAIITLLTLFYSVGYAYPTMIKRLFTHGTETYDFQILFELIAISVIYPLQDLGNTIKYYQLSFKGTKFNEVEHHLNNVKMLTVIAFTAIAWFSVHYRVENKYPIPTFWRILGSLIPAVVMVFTGSFGTYMKYFFGTTLGLPTPKEAKKKSS
jgi:hypothetical protein